MALWIQNVTKEPRGWDEEHDYEVKINHQPPMATFKHKRSLGAAACLRAAADAIDAADPEQKWRERMR